MRVRGRPRAPSRSEKRRGLRTSALRDCGRDVSLELDQLVFERLQPRIPGASKLRNRDRVHLEQRLEARAQLPVREPRRSRQLPSAESEVAPGVTSSVTYVAQERAKGGYHHRVEEPPARSRDSLTHRPRHHDWAPTTPALSPSRSSHSDFSVAARRGCSSASRRSSSRSGIPPVVLEQLTTLDFVTGGRVVTAVAAGWMEGEFATLGASFERRGRPPRRVAAGRRAAFEQMPGRVRYDRE